MDIVATLRQGDFLARIRALLFSPARAWGFIAIEAPDPLGLYLRFVMPLAAIPPLAKLISWSLFFGFITPGTAVMAALLAWTLNLVGVAILAVIAARLAPYFEGEERLDQALKLVAYASAPSWLGGVFRLMPVLGMLSLAASLYSVYLLYRGATPLMSVPPARSMSYALAMAAAALLLYFAFGTVIAMLLGLTALGMA